MRRRRRRLRRQWRQRDRSSLWSPSGNKKAPDLFRRGSGPDDAIVQLRAHVSRSPTGLSGFGGAFGARHHGAGTYGGLDRRQRLLERKSASTRLNRTPLLRNKLLHEASQSL